MIKRLAYKIVLKDLIKVNMFRGIYDARNGNDRFMNGVWTVMDAIAVKAGKFDEFDELFLSNLRESQTKNGKE